MRTWSTSPAASESLQECSSATRVASQIFAISIKILEEIFGEGPDVDLIKCCFRHPGVLRENRYQGGLCGQRNIICDNGCAKTRCSCRSGNGRKARKSRGAYAAVVNLIKPFSK